MRVRRKKPCSPPSGCEADLTRGAGAIVVTTLSGPVAGYPVTGRRCQNDGCQPHGRSQNPFYASMEISTRLVLVWTACDSLLIRRPVWMLCDDDER